MCLLLSLYPEVQEKCFRELDECLANNNAFIEKKCPYLCATMDEVFRYRPVTDSLPHLLSADTQLNGTLLKKGTIVVGSLTAIMHDPANFKDPEKFNPDRFIQNGKFVRDKRVCIFSVGNR